MLENAATGLNRVPDHSKSIPSSEFDGTTIRSTIDIVLGFETEIISMVHSAAIVLLLLICGDAIAERLDLPIPGAALGLVTLVAAFAARGGPDKGSEELFDFAAPYFPLFFVPAAVGVIANLDVLAFAWVHLATAIVVGTAITLLVTGLIAQALMVRIGDGARA